MLLIPRCGTLSTEYEPPEVHYTHFDSRFQCRQGGGDLIDSFNCCGQFLVQLDITYHLPMLVVYNRVLVSVVAHFSQYSGLSGVSSAHDQDSEALKLDWHSSIFSRARRQR